MDTRKVTMTGVFAAIICIATMIIQIPFINGYIHFGDGLVFISSVVLGSPYGMIASAIGSAMADMFSGYVFYAPFTLIIKGLMGLIVSKGASLEEPYSFKSIFFILIASLVMLLGYALTDIIYSMAITGLSFYEGLLVGLATLPGNIIQIVSGIIIYLIFVPIIKLAMKNIQTKNFNN